MNYKEFTSTFKRQVFNLTYEKQLAFALIISKKLFFDYQHFNEVYQWGNPDVLLDAINLCEQARVTLYDSIQIKEMIAKVDGITPEMDDFGEEVGSYALNACIAVIDTLEFLIDNDPPTFITLERSSPIPLALGYRKKVLYLKNILTTTQ